MMDVRTKRFTQLIVVLSVSVLLVCKGELNLVSRTDRLMGTLVTLTVPQGHEMTLDSAFNAMRQVDSLMSYRREGSDVWRLNRADGRWVRVSEHTRRCLELSLEVAQGTDGAFDPTAGALVHAWRFDRDKQEFPPESAIEEAMALVDYRRIEISGDSIRIGIGQRIDLGGIAKGYAIDLAAEKLRELGVERGIVDAGGDLFLLGDKVGNPWRTGVRHPRDREKLIYVLEVRDVSVCTSGDYERYFVKDGRRYTHIFDPRTGYPVQDVMSVTVIGKNAATADAYATGFFVLGAEGGIEAAEKLTDVEALIIHGEDFSENASSGFSNFQRND
jgi:thiamine biosynthesis lipoprotein